MKRLLKIEDDERKRTKFRNVFVPRTLFFSSIPFAIDTILVVLSLIAIQFESRKKWPWKKKLMEKIIM